MGYDKNLHFTTLQLFSLFSISILLLSCLGNPSEGADAGAILKDQEAMYQEPHRPQYHFTPEANWMNDPNGMVYYEGEYHLFYQYYPDSTVWGPMHWGHAVSTDLVSWQHLPVALYPDELGYIFSGSAVIDWNNTTGFGEEGTPPMVAIFTHHDPDKAKAKTGDHENQSLAYSNDKGRTWTKYAGNPVLPNTEKIYDFRDPKVVWDAQRERWLMALAVLDHTRFYASPDLKEWSFLSEWGKGVGAHDGVWECPDFFPMTVAGSDEEKWVLLQSLNPGGLQGGSGTQYFVGDFDGTNFTLDPRFAEEVTNGQGVWIDYGRDNYAGVTWSDVPAEDGRKLFLGWMSNWEYANVVPTEKWRSAMTVARTLELVKEDAGYRLISEPVRELEKLRGTATRVQPLTIADAAVLNEGFAADQCEVRLTFDLSTTTATTFGVSLSNAAGEVYLVGYDGRKGEVFSNRLQAGPAGFSEKFTNKVHRAPYSPAGGTLEMQILFDRSSAELFIDGGRLAMTDLYFPSERFTKLMAFAEGGEVAIREGTIWPLAGTWSRK